MKTISLVIVLLGAGLGSVLAQSAVPSVAGSSARSEYQITEQAADSQVWQKTEYETTPDGRRVAHVHQYTEVATGLNYRDHGKWVAAKERIEILPNGTAVAIQGRHKAYFPGDIYEGAIKVTTPDGQNLVSRPLGLCYFDGTNTVLIAELTNSIGTVVGDNQVIYANAFTDFKVDLRYTYTMAGFEQDIILRQQPPTPESLGLNPDTARLQVMTEFFDPPQPTIRSRKLAPQAGLRLTDEALDFGALQMVPGRAFLLGGQAKAAGAQVSKQWVRLAKRQFLVEEVPVDAILEGLANLPLTALNAGSGKRSRIASRHLVLPPQRLAMNQTSSSVLLAKADLPAAGYVLDYQTVNTAQTNVTFQGDTTYYISGAAILNGTTTFEGGTVIKYAVNASLVIYNPAQIIGLGSAYHPLVFTAKDDNTVGELITGSTGSPSGYYANPALDFHAYRTGVSSNTLSHFRIAWAKQAISTPDIMGTFSHGQLVNCQNGISAQYIPPQLRDMLFANVLTNFNVDSVSVDVQNTTFSGSANMIGRTINASGGATLVNCLLVNVTNIINSGDTTYVSGGHNGFYNSPTFGDNQITSTFYPFQTAAGGNYYLANGCAFKDQGTTNIEASLLASLKQRTTYPPVCYTNYTFTTNGTFSPQAQRDTDTPDLGYHYAPLDYVFGGCTANSNLTFTAGTAVGWFRTTSGWYHAGQGIRMNGDLTVSFDGTVTSPTYWVRLNTVQEQDGTAGYGHGGIENWSGPYTPIVRGRFLRCSAMPGENFNGYFAGDYGGIHAEMTDSEFYSGNLGTYGDYMVYTNCLMERTYVVLWNGNPVGALYLQNCTMRGGVFQVMRNSAGATPISMRNSAFDGTAFILSSDYYGSNPSYTDYDYNAYTNTTDPFSIGGTHDVKGITNFNWQSSWFGNYYQPTNSPLINVGSTTANLLGLYHFTTQTNQIVEGNSQVDIGYHYVATDAYGNPIDTDGDGIPDYLEDSNGNGVFDAGDLGNWLIG